MRSRPTPHSFGRRAIACILALFLASSAFASKAGSIIAGVSGMQAGKWGIIAVVDPEPASKTACGIIAGVWGIIGGGAALYSAIVDPLPQGPPTITAVVEGPAVDRDRGTGELIPPPGVSVHRAQTMRVVSIVGKNFSWTPSDMKVMFGQMSAQILPLSTNTVLMAIVPDSPSASGVRAPIVVTVNGVASASYAFTVDPEIPVPPNAVAIKDALLAKEKKHLALAQAFDWKAQARREKPTITDAELASAMVGADQMVKGTKDVQANLPVAEQGLQQTYGTFAQFVVTNPEFEALLDQSIADLQ